MIRKVELGQTGELVSCMGLGTMYFGSKLDERTSFDMLDYYTEQGGILLDTANKYASWVPGFEGGESERVIGKWMRGKSNRPGLFITSKVGFPYGDIPRSLKKEIIISECEKSLERLGTGTIDLYFAHAPDPLTPVEETMEAFYRLKKEGKIRNAGASNYAAWQLCEARTAANLQEWEGFACIQQRHTYLEPVLRANFGAQLVLTPELEEYCSREKLGIMAYSPLLGGAYVKEDLPLQIHYRSAANDVRMARLKEVAGELNASINRVVLAWMVLSSPVIIPLVAGSSIDQIKENLLPVSLSRSHLEILNRDVVPPEKY
jgi:aryl-alcohol dehydrogenase-like predicted oxidoreductase